MVVGLQERCFRKIFDNLLINSEDLKGMNRYQLDLVKHFVYAKHNYQFDLEFYQSYFNLFAFYNTEEKRKSRITEVSKVLTESDNKNLIAITNALKKYEK